MSVTKQTTRETEADLEARINAAVRVAFPWLPSGALKHQTRFLFKFGRAVVEIDGAAVSSAQARADVLVQFNNTPGGLPPSDLLPRQQGGRPAPASALVEIR